MINFPKDLDARTAKVKDLKNKAKQVKDRLGNMRPVKAAGLFKPKTGTTPGSVW